MPHKHKFIAMEISQINNVQFFRIIPVLISLNGCILMHAKYVDKYIYCDELNRKREKVEYGKYCKNFTLNRPFHRENELNTSEQWFVFVTYYVLFSD